MDQTWYDNTTIEFFSSTCAQILSFLPIFELSYSGRLTFFSPLKLGK